MDEKKLRPAGDTPETAEPPEAEKLSERVPDEASGEPLGALAEHGSRLQQYRKRIEKLASSLRDGAEQHAPRRCSAGWPRRRRTSLNTSMAWRQEPG